MLQNEYILQNDEMLQSEEMLHVDSKVDHILMLDDYCFLQIFKRLSLYDLANFKEAFLQ